MKNLKSFIALTVILTQVLWSIDGYANPSGGTVVSGAATIVTTGNTLTVNQSTNQLITNWQSFSIAAGETTQFIQPSSSSVALNRVIGQNPSDIFGTLKSNGQVFLINPNGVLFAPGSQVNVGGLVASTLDIPNQEFLNGAYQSLNSNGQLITTAGYRFLGRGDVGSVINDGTIKINAPGGYAALLGSIVENGPTGSIITTAGPVVLASGTAIAVNLDANGSISAVLVNHGLNENSSGSANAILNAGTITANGGNVIITADSLAGIFDNLVNNTGIIQANNVYINSNGNVSLSGDITASKNVSISGNNITGGSTGSINGVGTLDISAVGNIGSSAHPLNIDFGTVSGSSTNGDIYLNSTNAVTLSDLYAEDGLINVTADGQITADNITTGGGATNSISLTSTFGDIDIEGNINADGGLGDVALNSAGNIINTGTNNIITANNLNLSAGINGSIVGNTFRDVTTYINAQGQQVLVFTNQPGAASYNIYVQYGSFPPQLLASNISASNGSTTTWINPSAVPIGLAGTYFVEVTSASTSNIGSSINPINSIVNNITAVSQDIGDINLNQEGQSVALKDLTTVNGSINVTTTAGSMDVGTINAAGGAGNVNLNSAASITNNSGTGLITANNLNFTSGDVVGTGATVIPSISNGDIVLNIENTNGYASYNIYSSVTLGGPQQLVATVNATSGATTQWIGPAVTSAPSGFYTVVVSSATVDNVGTSANRINTDANTITGLTNAGPGNIYLNSVSPVTLANLHATNGLIDVIAAGDMTAQNITTGSGQANSITLKTTAGNIDVGIINAAGGSGNVSLSAAASITNNSGNGLVTANNFNFTSGNVVGTGAVVIPSISNGDIVLNIENTNGYASYDIYSSITLGGPQILVATVNATSGATTQWIGPAVASAPSGFYTVTVASASTSNVGTSTNPIKTFVNTINGQAYAGTISGIDIDQGAEPLTIANMNAATGPINVISARRMYAENVTTGGGALDSINLSTSIGGIDTGTINAAGGLGNVTLNAAAGITNSSGTGMITANDFNFTSGNIVGTGALVTPEVLNGNIVLLIQNPIEAQSYNIYSVTLGSAPVLIATIAASSGAITQWIGPTVASAPSGYFTVSIASAAGVGTSTNPINTNVNMINGQDNAPTGGIYLNSIGAVTLNLNAINGLINVNAGGPITAQNVTTANAGPLDSITLTANSGDIAATSINSAGDLFLDSVNGSIVGAGVGTNVTSGGDTHLTAGDLIGSWSPYLPLSINVGGDLYLAIGQRAGSATGTVGTMGVSGTLAGTVGGAYHFAPGTYVPYNFANSVFNGNPPGYIFLYNGVVDNEIWPDLPLLPTSVVNINDTLADSQIGTSLQPNQSVTYEEQRHHKIKPDELVAPLSIQVYHATLDDNTSAIDHIQVNPEVYDFIDARINSVTPAIQVQGQK